MTEEPSRARRSKPAKLPIWSTLRRVGEIYVGQFGFLVALGVVVGIPIGLVDALVGNLEITDASLAEALGTAGAGLAGFAFILFAGQLYEGVAGSVAAQIQRGEGRPSDLGALVRRLPLTRLLAANLLYVIGTIVGLLLLFVPGVVFFVLFAPVVTLISLERGALWPSFNRSRKLVRGNFWRVLLIVGAAYLIASEIDTALDAIELWTVGRTFLADWIVATLATALLTPIAAVTAVIVTLRLIELEPAE